MDAKKEFDLVICELQNMFDEKYRQYGDSAFYKGINHNGPYKWWARFSDVARKFVRLEILTTNAAEGVERSQAKLIDDYKDLAIYAIIAVAVLEDKK